MGLGKLVSGGQTGVDRAALDVAVATGLPYGGWCPAGGWAEDMPTPPGLLGRYPLLREAPDADPAERTRLNVRDSDATLVLRDASSFSLGTELTERVALRLGRPLRVVDLAQPHAAAQARALLDSLPSAATLNVAGPRESETPGVYERARRLLDQLLRSV